MSFKVFAPLTFFEKADAKAGETRRIAGVISTENLDKQGEVVIQKGLDFTPFLNGGWYNDNHSKKTADILGYPEQVKQFQKGERLPDGTQAPTNLTWAEGYLLNTPDADRIWQLGNALKKSGGNRRLGFSIEGAVQRRVGPSNNIVAKAVVRNVAITNCPVGEGTRLETLAKSLDAVEKGLSMGDEGGPPAMMGEKTGEGAGRILAKQSLESDDDDEDSDDEYIEKSIQTIREELSCSEEFAREALEVITKLKA